MSGLSVLSKLASQYSYARLTMDTLPWLQSPIPEYEKVALFREKAPAARTICDSSASPRRILSSGLRGEL